MNQDSEMNTHIPGKNGLRCAGLILLAATLLPSASFGHTSGTEHSQAAAESSSQIDAPISKALPNGIEIHRGKLTLQVVALSETVLRVRQSGQLSYPGHLGGFAAHPFAVALESLPK